ncbi:MAG: GTP-binding protein [Microcystis aeruginosa BK11-02]|nr:GTP-binding protein [Microcystis aeruginosa BK11-02]
MSATFERRFSHLILFSVSYLHSNSRRAGKPKTQLVFIGQNLDTEKMRSLLAACLSDNQ